MSWNGGWFADKTGPLHIAEYSALLMNITEGKCHSLAVLRGCLNELGFEWLGHKPTAVGRGFIAARKAQHRFRESLVTEKDRLPSAEPGRR